MHSSDWLPSKRNKILEMAGSWTAYITNARRNSWGVTEEELENLKERLSNTESEYATPSGNRTPVYYSRLNEQFVKLKSVMRDIKRRRFLSPPLDEADFIALGLKPKDTVKTNVGEPKIPVEGDLTYPTAGIVEIVNIRGIGESADRRPSYGVRIYYGVMGEPTPKDKFRISDEPKTGNDLPHSIFTRRKRIRFDFSGDSGQAVYFCMRYENSKGQAGPWGKVIKTFIP